jgi:hypothetical protein
MPIVVDDDRPSLRRRGRKVIWLLLLPLLVVVGLAVSAIFHPLEIPVGPMILVVLTESDIGSNEWRVGSARFGANDHVMMRDREFLTTGSGFSGFVQFGRGAYGFAWFRGKRMNPVPVN